MGPIEKYLSKIESKKILKEDSTPISPKVQAFLDECDRLSAILRDDNLFEVLIKEKTKETLRTWFKRQGAPGKTGGWVDCNSPIRKDGEITGYKPCGRQKGEERAKYPSCRPTASKCNDKGKGKTWGKTK